MNAKLLYIVFLKIVLCNVVECINTDPVHSYEIQNNRPIFGIIAQSTWKFESINSHGKNYIAASYVKFLESSGARVVPIMANATENEIKEIFDSINGVVLPGGLEFLNMSNYVRIARIVFKLAKTSNDHNDYFPLVGICLGYEFLASMVTGSLDILLGTDSDNYTTPLILPHNFRDTNMFRDISDDLVHSVRTFDALPHFHRKSVTLSGFEKNKPMKEFFRVVSTNRDRKGLEFVATMEARKYPFYVMQWHPEKIPFEWSRERNVPHHPISIRISQYISNFIVNEARKSEHKFKTLEEEEAAVIYTSYNPMYTGNVTIFEQCYMFD